MIEIDPNVRVEHNRTFSLLEDLPEGFKEGDGIVAFEGESGMTFPASIVSIDRAKGLVYLDVSWRKCRVVEANRR